MRLGDGIGARNLLLGALAVGLLVGLVVAAVRIATGGDGGDGGDDVAAGTPAGWSPGEVAGRFAAAWAAQDIDALYLLLDPVSQAAHPREALGQAYARFATETTLAGLAVQAGGAGPEGASLSVRLSTRYFGEISYLAALSFSLGVDRAYRVAWSPATIHPELTDGREMRSELQKPVRGAILDRDGRPLAITRDARILGLHRAAVGDRAALTSATVALGFTLAEVEGAFASPLGLNQRVTIGVVPDAMAEQAALAVRSHAGLLLYFEARRTHPLGATAAHVVGYTRELTADELAARAGMGYSVGDRTGAIGIELGMDSVLAGAPGGVLRLAEPDGTVVKSVAFRQYTASQDVRTTLHGPTLQAVAARLGNRAGAAVVLDPRSNAILALNSAPSFDPDAFERGDQAAVNAILARAGDPLLNRATVGLYSAGSTFKLVTGAAGLARGGYTPTSLIDCPAVWTRVDPPRRNWEGAQGLLTIAGGLMRSCNPVFYEIALTLHLEAEGALSAMARTFGFGASTGVAGFAEAAGLVPDAEWKRRARGEAWFAGDDINLGLGQGDLLVTPLQLANAYSALLAGQLRTPVVLDGAQAAARGAIPLSAAQSAHLRRGLELVTSPSGTAAGTFAGYFGFAGKSGTAEDAGEQTHVLFVAYAPSGAPEALAAVVLDDGQSGSTEAGPIARDAVLAVLLARD